MQDRLVWLLERFELRAEVFHSGTVLRCVHHDVSEGVGHLHMLRGGSVLLESPGSRPQLVAEPSAIFYLNPTSHALTPGSDGADLVCANVDFGVGQGNPLRLALPEVVVVPLADAPALAEILTLLFREAETDHCGRQAVLNRLSEVALVQILRELMDQQRMEMGLLAGLAEPRLARAINAIHAEPARAWTLDGLAAEAGMSRARFAVKFRDTVGMTPGSYLSEWRLGLAQSLLRRGTPVNVVADEVGYANASALSRVFTARKGEPPTAWVRRVAATDEPDDPA
ncbi:MAG: AraC family transcriptional regulator [Gammaproteobacteria bacterium]|nr:AraC family transcriptional regulator [Gammaproteobacteria bacterium]MBK82042.1 AraC family transcriptional regulator [Gammaproteobacteria bacterium]